MNKTFLRGLNITEGSHLEIFATFRKIWNNEITMFERIPPLTTLLYLFLQEEDCAELDLQQHLLIAVPVPERDHLEYNCPRRSPSLDASGADANVRRE